jgi:hypothetical protein
MTPEEASLNLVVFQGAGCECGIEAISILRVLPEQEWTGDAAMLPDDLTGGLDSEGRVVLFAGGALRVPAALRVRSVERAKVLPLPSDLFPPRVAEIVRGVVFPEGGMPILVLRNDALPRPKRIRTRLSVG